MMNCSLARKLAAFAAMALLLATQASADSWRMAVRGQKQGVLRAGPASAAQGRAGMEMTPCLGVAYEVAASYSPSSGAFTGAMQPSPVVVTKPFGPLSPQLLAAADTNELLPEVVLEHIRTLPGGIQGAGVLAKTGPTYRIVLTNARIVKLRWYTEGSTPTASGAALEELSLIYDQMTLSTLPNGPEVTVNWGPSNS